MKEKDKTSVQLSQVLCRLKEVRCHQGLTQKDIAAKLNVSQNAYSKIENGRTNLQLSVFFLICEILDIEAGPLISYIADTRKITG
ncbi:helix-turn-helix transcriptional regulator [Mucilaginibacter sp. 21P]|uniref:helix-turn-helix domain-containing protein n=1 Tax=Mucilaginibacter sp. 21P TaxID=2778902 RepID=UPI001C57DF61|nr:helix-turn-helix transcriptional regulator [Mucilaginibacter sp. 21P]QXV63797.1 helix-turn-helix transcriptional regulator [Mucilaginibacter sp. 21P]